VNRRTRAIPFFNLECTVYVGPVFGSMNNGIALISGPTFVETNSVRPFAVTCSSIPPPRSLPPHPLGQNNPLPRHCRISVVRESKPQQRISSDTHGFAGRLPNIGRLLRGYWAIENSPHYVRDATFAEDASRIRLGTAPEISTTIRRASLNMLQRDTTVKDDIRGKRLRAGGDETNLDQIWAGFTAL
jgi:predicted transposase YbfD/YdcC